MFPWFRNQPSIGMVSITSFPIQWQSEPAQEGDGGLKIMKVAGRVQASSRRT
jgi:hypothetical protein